MIKPRFIMLKNGAGVAAKLLFLKEKNIAEPIMNKKKGKTKSVGVQPCQSACNNGAYTCAQEPGVLTKIIKAIVIPLKASSAK